MSTLNVSPLLRFALTLDTVATGLTGALMLPLAGTLAELLALPYALLAGAAAVMLVYAAILGMLRARPTLPRWAVWTIIVGNAVWALDCVALALLGFVEPSALGVGFLIAQAVAVAGFAELQYFGLRRSVPAG